MFIIGFHYFVWSLFVSSLLVNPPPPPHPHPSHCPPPLLSSQSLLCGVGALAPISLGEPLLCPFSLDVSNWVLWFNNKIIEMGSPKQDFCNVRALPAYFLMPWHCQKYPFHCWMIAIVDNIWGLGGINVSAIYCYRSCLDLCTLFPILCCVRREELFGLVTQVPTRLGRTPYSVHSKLNTLGTYSRSMVKPQGKKVQANLSLNPLTHVKESGGNGTLLWIGQQFAHLPIFIAKFQKLGQHEQL